MKHELRDALGDACGFAGETKTPVGAGLQAAIRCGAGGWVGDATVDEEAHRASNVAVKDTLGRGED